MNEVKLPMIHQDCCERQQKTFLAEVLLHQNRRFLHLPEGQADQQ